MRREKNPYTFNNGLNWAKICEEILFLRERTRIDKRNIDYLLGALIAYVWVDTMRTRPQRKCLELRRCDVSRIRWNPFRCSHIIFTCVNSTEPDKYRSGSLFHCAFSLNTLEKGHLCCRCVNTIDCISSNTSNWYCCRHFTIFCNRLRVTPFYMSSPIFQCDRYAH